MVRKNTHSSVDRNENTNIKITARNNLILNFDCSLFTWRRFKAAHVIIICRFAFDYDAECKATALDVGLAHSWVLLIHLPADTNHELQHRTLYHSRTRGVLATSESYAPLRQLPIASSKWTRNPCSVHRVNEKRVFSNTRWARFSTVCILSRILFDFYRLLRPTMFTRWWNVFTCDVPQRRHNRLIYL